MYADDSNNQWPQFTGNTTWTYNWAYYSNKWEAVGRLYAGDYVNAKQSFFCPCDDVVIGNLALNWKNPGNYSIGTSYCLRGYDQTLKGKVGPKLDGVSNRAVISCYFLYSPGQYPRLAFHRTTYTYPVLFGDGHVSIAKFPTCFSRYQPPDLSNNTYQHPFWDSHDTYR